jgi:hypothetical protein
MHRPTIRPSILIFIALSLLTACSALHGRKDNVYDWHNIVGMAWNQDTVNDYRILFYRNNAFSYIVKTSPKPRVQEVNIYEGAYTITPDTVYLTFKGKQQPPMLNYMIRDASDFNLIQYFHDGRPGMSLKKEHPPENERSE